MIIFKDVSKRYDKNSPFVLDKISLELNKGNTYALLGNNGSGKTTIVHLICNLLSCDNGEIFAFNQKVTPGNVFYKGRIGMVLSESYFIEEFSITEYWYFVSKFQGVPKKEIPNRISDLIKLFELDEISETSICKLSSGNRAKVSLGAALIHDPELLILDEPFTNLDIKSKQTLLSAIRIIKKNKTILLTSHDLELVTEVCDNYLILDGGKIISEFSIDPAVSLDKIKDKIKKYLMVDNQKLAELDWLS